MANWLAITADTITPANLSSVILLQRALEAGCALEASVEAFGRRPINASRAATRDTVRATAKAQRSKQHGNIASYPTYRMYTIVRIDLHSRKRS
jgi:hypothetical protein